MFTQEMKDDVEHLVVMEKSVKSSNGFELQEILRCWLRGCFVRRTLLMRALSTAEWGCLFTTREENTSMVEALLAG